VSNKLQAIRGMNDILPKEMGCWHKLEQAIRDITQLYGYEEIRMPIVEKTSLFKRTIGDVTDIVQKEMYTFEDRNGDSLTLRPEGTASCVRACIEHGLIDRQTQRLWYMGPMFRHERPQKGRYRQFYQFGVEAFGFDDVDVELELLLLSHRLWKQLGIQEHIKLEINTIGESEERQTYREELQTYFSTYIDEFDEEDKTRIKTNPLRLLDSKNEKVKNIAKGAPSFMSSLSDASLARFERICDALKACDIEYVINPRLVRGLDYYSHTVFEWVTESLGAQGTVCAGGRYDGLVKQCGGRGTPAVGFALGLERLALMLDAFAETTSVGADTCDIYVVIDSNLSIGETRPIIEKLRTALPSYRIRSNLGAGSFKSQFKKADKSGAIYALVLGEDEIKTNKMTLEYLRENKEKEVETLDNIVSAITSRSGETV
jgi:histidyl-tRNA synthetase